MQATVVKSMLSTVPERPASNDESDEEVVVSLLGDEPKVDPPERGIGATRAMFGVELTNSPTKRCTEAMRPDGECGDTSCTTGFA